MPNLVDRKCRACEDKNLKPFVRADMEDYLMDVPRWILSLDEKKISRTFEFKNFVQAIDFVSGVVADIAEGEGHHPDISIQYNKVVLELWTHSIDGLSENDFIVAAKIDAIFP